jgi:transglutaminase-like putative cysteine protease
VKPSPEIAAKAAELTKGAPDEKTTIKNIYAFVSTRFRYIGIDLGMGRYQPHSAADVLENGYGDCKDKHT